MRHKLKLLSKCCFFKVRQYTFSDLTMYLPSIQKLIRKQVKIPVLAYLRWDYSLNIPDVLLDKSLYLSLLAGYCLCWWFTSQSTRLQWSRDIFLFSWIEPVLPENKNFCSRTSDTLITNLTLNIQANITGPCSAVGNVSGNCCESDCRSTGHEFGPGPVPYFRGDWFWNNFYGHSPPFLIMIQEGLFVSYKWKYMHEVLVNCLFKLIQKKSVVRWTDRPAITIAIDLGL